MRRLLTGLILCLLGALFLLDAAHLLSIGSVLKEFFPFVLVATGLLILFTGKRTRSTNEQKLP